MTGGADENVRLLRDPNSGVDVAFMQGGVVRPAEADGLVMLARLYYEPCGSSIAIASTLSQIDELAGKRIAMGSPGSGCTRAWNSYSPPTASPACNTELVLLVD